MSSSVVWLGGLVLCVVAFGSAGYGYFVEKARIRRHPHDRLRAYGHRAEFEARLTALSSPRTTAVEPTRRPVYELTSALLAQIEPRVERVDPNHAPGAPDCLWLLLAAGEDNIGDRLWVSPVEEDDGLWLVEREATFKFQRPVTEWRMTGSMDEVVKGVLADLASRK
jgi:hypothetical protein